MNSNPDALHEEPLPLTDILERGDLPDRGPQVNRLCKNIFLGAMGAAVLGAAVEAGNHYLVGSSNNIIVNAVLFDIYQDLFGFDLSRMEDMQRYGIEYDPRQERDMFFYSTSKGVSTFYSAGISLAVGGMLSGISYLGLNNAVKKAIVKNKFKIARVLAVVAATTGAFVADSSFYKRMKSDEYARMYGVGELEKVAPTRVAASAAPSSVTIAPQKKAWMVDCDLPANSTEPFLELGNKSLCAYQATLAPPLSAEGVRQYILGGNLGNVDLPSAVPAAVKAVTAQLYDGRELPLELLINHASALRKIIAEQTANYQPGDWVKINFLVAKELGFMVENTHAEASKENSLSRKLGRAWQTTLEMPLDQRDGKIGPITGASTIKGIQQ